MHTHRLPASWTISSLLLPSLWAESAWAWEESGVFSASLHFPSELGSHFLPQLSVLPFLGCLGLETTTQTETDHNLLGAKAGIPLRQVPWGVVGGAQSLAREPLAGGREDHRHHKASTTPHPADLWHPHGMSPGLTSLPSAPLAPALSSPPHKQPQLCFWGGHTALEPQEPGPPPRACLPPFPASVSLSPRHQVYFRPSRGQGQKRMVSAAPINGDCSLQGSPVCTDRGNPFRSLRPAPGAPPARRQPTPQPLTLASSLDREIRLRISAQDRSPRFPESCRLPLREALAA